MITASLILKNLRLLFIVALIVIGVWLYKDYQFQKAENVRQTENASQLRKSDSLRFTSQILTQGEIKEYLKYQNPDLEKKLNNVGIKINRIESLVSRNYTYKDTTKRETDITGLIESIKNSIPKEQTWVDTTKCQTIKGLVKFDGSTLKVIVSDREFKNKSDDIVYWERNQWKFLGIKTRLFGKKIITSTSFNDCGESKTIKIEKKK